jgi:hypothetical protein
LLPGARISLFAAAAAAIVLPLLLLTVALFAAGGFFNIILDRFAYDGGSALTRLEMLEIFDYLSWREILIGTSSDVVDSLRRTHGLEWGIENPVVRLLLYQGAVVTALLVSGFALFLAEITRRLRPGIMMPLVYFLITANSYESIANKTILLGEFIVLMMVMFRPPPRRLPVRTAR